MYRNTNTPLTRSDEAYQRTETAATPTKSFHCLLRLPSLVIMKNNNINKLSKNAYHVYTLLNKYKDDNTNLLISSYLAGNNSTDLYNTINKNLYNKLKNNQITKQNYNNI